MPPRLRPGELIGCPNAELAGCGRSRSCDACALRAIVTQALERGTERQRIPIQLTVSHEAEPRAFLASTRRCDSQSGEPRVLVALSDVTELRYEQEVRNRLEAQALQGQKLESLGLLAASIAHDFNNMLTTVFGNLDLVVTDLPEESEDRVALSDAREAAGRAAELAQQLLAYAGRGKVELATVDLGALVEELESLLRVVVSNRALVQLDLGEAPPVTADATRLRQAVVNLVKNAAEATTDPTSAISVVVGQRFCDAATLLRLRPDARLPAGDYAALVVRDQGAGMTAEDLERVHDPFFSTKGTGRGLGMASVFGFARSHGGAVEFRSRPGAGTTVTLLLPAEQRPSTTAPAPATVTRPAPRPPGPSW